jgi:hypothetical protein
VIEKAPTASPTAALEPSSSRLTNRGRPLRKIPMARKWKNVAPQSSRKRERTGTAP